MTTEDAIVTGQEALRAARWEDARACFETTLGEREAPEALAGMSDALYWLGDVRQSVEYRRRAYAAFRRVGHALGAAESALWLCACYGMVFGNRPAARGWLARAERIAREAGTEAGSLDGWVALFAALDGTDLARTRDVLERTLAMAREWDDHDLELWALSDLGVVLVQLGEVESGLRYADEAMAGALGGDAAQFDTVVHASCSMLTLCDLLADLDRATQWCRAADEFTRAYGGRFLFAYCRVTYGRVLLATGRWAEAERELTEAVESARDLFPATHARAVGSLAELRLRQGRLDEAGALLARLDDPIEAAPVAAALALRRREPAVAVAHLERWLRAGGQSAWTSTHPRGELPPDAASALALLIDAHLELGDAAAARAALARLDSFQAANGSALAAPLAALARGRVLAAAGEPGSAARIEEAIERFARLGLPLETARARLSLARAIAGSERAVAVAEARAAFATFDRLGATSEADDAAALLRSWGASGRTGPRLQGTLTRREQEILALLAAGLSNQEIAERLVISRKTAAHHVSNVLGKLNLRNRAEAAAYAARSAGDGQRP